MNNYEQIAGNTDYLTKGYANIAEQERNELFIQYNTSKEFAQLVDEYMVKYPSLTENYILSEANKVMKNPSSKGQIEGNLSFYQNTSPIDFRVLNDPYQWGPWLTMAGEGLILDRAQILGQRK